MPAKVYPTAKDDGRDTVGLVTMGVIRPYTLSILSSTLLILSIVVS